MFRLLHHRAVRTHLFQLIRFAISGGIGASVDLGTTSLLVEIFGVRPAIAYLPSVGLAVTVVFLLNKHFTFRNKERQYRSQVLKFAIVYGTAVASNLSISYVLLWLGVHYLLAKVIAIGIGAIWNYTMSHGFVFRKPDEADVAIV